MASKVQKAVGGLVVGLALVVASATVFAADEPAKKDTYPLATCVVSGEKLGGDMGKPVIYDYKGREIRFCCAGCIKTFTKNPEKYLKILDEAEAKAKAAVAKDAPKVEAPAPAAEK